MSDGACCHYCRRYECVCEIPPNPPTDPPAHDFAGLADEDTTYGALLRITEGHGTTPIYETIAKLRAELAAALREDEGNRTDLERIIAVAHKHGWNGVENSKILWDFLDNELTAAEGMRAELALWKPLTPEEAEAELEKAEGVPLSDERIAEMVRFATDPANVLPNNQQMQLAADNKRLRADLAVARAELERVKAELADDAAASAELARMPPLTLEDVDKIKRAASRAEGGGK